MLITNKVYKANKKNSSVENLAEYLTGTSRKRKSKWPVDTTCASFP